MEDPTLAYEDMLFFERRLTEVISGMKPRVRKWKALLVFIFLSTAYSAYYWVSDPSLKIISFSESLMRHPTFTACLSILIVLFIVFGVHKRVVAPRIVATRCRSVLGDFCLSCDDYGKLIVRPAYSPAVSPTPSYSISSTSHMLAKQQQAASLPQPAFGSNSSAGLDLAEDDSAFSMDSPSAVEENRLAHSF